MIQCVRRQNGSRLSSHLRWWPPFAKMHLAHLNVDGGQAGAALANLSLKEHLSGVACATGTRHLRRCGPTGARKLYRSFLAPVGPQMLKCSGCVARFCSAFHQKNVWRLTLTRALRTCWRSSSDGCAMPRQRRGSARDVLPLFSQNGGPGRRT